MPDSGLAGQSGLMPANIWKEKYEITSIDESSSAVEDYQRQAMQDFSCDATFFESDHKREDNHSEEFLSIRHEGHRSGETPDAPDLFLELTERDPRGTALDPNMRHLIEQSYSRADYFRFSDDSDNSVTEREKRPQQLIAQIRDQFENIKARLKIFATSKGNFASSGKTQQGLESRTGTSIQGGGNISAHRDADSVNRYTTVLSNTLPLGWEQTGDHEFKIAKLGQVRSALAGGEDVELNRADVREDQTDKLTRFQDQTVTVGLAQLMKQLALEKSRRDVTTDRTYSASSATTPSLYNAFRRTKAATADVATDQKDQEVFRAMENFIGALKNQTGLLAGRNIEDQLQIVELMDHATRNSLLGRMDTKRVANEVQSAKIAETFAATINSKSRSRTTARRETDGSSKMFESMAVAHLGSRARPGVGDQRRKELMGENYARESAATLAQKIKNPNLRNPYTGVEEQQHATFGTKDRFTKGLGSKFTRDKMDTTRTLNDMADL